MRKSSTHDYCWIAMFNKRRIAEVLEMKVSDFLQVEQNDELDSEIYNSLDMSEKILSNRYVTSKISFHIEENMKKR